MAFKAAFRDLRLLLRVRKQAAWNGVRFASKTEQRVGLGLFAGGVVLFGLVLSAFALLLQSVQTQSPDAANALIEQTHFWVFLFLLAGGVPFVSGVLFAHGDEAHLFAQSPASPTVLVVARLWDAVLASSSQFLVLGVPLLFACGWAVHLAWWAWPIFMVLIALQITVPALLVAALLLLCARVLGVRRVQAAVALASVLLAVGLCLVSVQAFSQQANRGLTLSSFASAVAAAQKSSRPADFTPPTWAAHALLALGSPRPLDCAPLFALLAGMTIVLGAVCVSLGKTVLRGDLFSGDASRYSASQWWETLSAKLPLAPPLRALLVKDARYLFRDLVLLSQIGTPLILYFVPFVIGAQLKGSSSTSDLLYLCLGVVGTIAYMETSILGLSGLGLEGRGFWLVLSAPVSAGLLLRAKWTGAFALSVLICAPLWLLACAVYQASATVTAGGLCLLLIACAALCGLAVGIAGIFPRFVYENPAHRASLSALVWGFVFASGYVLIGGAFLGLGWFGATQWPEKNAWFWAGGLGAFLVLSLAALLLPLQAARRRLDGFAWET